MRVLRSSLLEAALTQEQIDAFLKKDFIDLKRALENEMIRASSPEASSPVAELYLSSRLFHHDANIEALPFELYRIPMEESDFHG